MQVNCKFSWYNYFLEQVVQLEKVVKIISLYTQTKKYIYKLALNQGAKYSMQTSENENSLKKQDAETESNALRIVTQYKILGLFSISEDKLNQLRHTDKEVLSNPERLYLVLQTSFLGKMRLFATPFRTNIPKNQKPYTVLRKMSGACNTKKGCTHGLHIAKTIPVTKKALLNSRHFKAYKPLMNDGTFTSLISDILNWLSIFEDNEVAEDFTPYFYSVKLKKLANEINN